MRIVGCGGRRHSSSPHRHLSLLLLLSLLFVLICLCRVAVAEDSDPYEVLGVKRSASQREIQKAYHRLSRLHHPDKNRNDPNANDRFSKINEAYETLSDPEKRKNFDAYGRSGPPGGGGGGGFHSPGSFFFHHGGGGGFSDPFEFMFNFAGAGGGGGGGHGGGAAGDSMRVTRRLVETKLMPESVFRPCLILAKAHMCFQCGPISQLWSRIADELSSYGVTMATAYLDEPGGLAEYLRVTSVPSIIGISNRRIFNYASHENSREISISSLISFLRKMLPPNLLESVTDANFQSSFILSSGGVPFEDGRVRVLLGFSAPPSERNARGFVPPPLRFALAAFRHRLQAKFACIRIDVLYSKDTQDTFERYQLPRIGETISIFDENYEKTGPVYQKFTNPSSAGQPLELSAATIDAVIAKRGFLSLPRIYSSHMLSLVCPPESEADADSPRELTICVMLIVDKRAPLPTVLDQFRDFAQRFMAEKASQMSYKVRFCYVFASIQTGFIAAMRQSRPSTSSSSSSASSSLDVAIFRHRERGQVSYDLVDAGWDSSAVDGSEQQVTQRILLYKGHSGRKLPYFARIPELLDENRESLLQRIWWRLIDWFDRISFTLTSSDAPMFYVTLLCTLFVGVGSVVIHSVMSAVRVLIGSPSSSSSSFSGNNAAQQQGNNAVNMKHPQVDQRQRMLNVKLFCAETCDQLVKDLPRGELAVVLLTTREVQGGLLTSFVEAITPFTKYHRLRFAYMDLDLPENQLWYHKLLELSVGREVDIKMDRCAGTVLAINGYRDYYCLYHPAYKSVSTIGRFAGLEDDDDGDAAENNQYARMMTHDPKKVLLHLPQWLDSLLDGNLKRFRLERWPNMAEIVAAAQAGNDGGGSGGAAS